MKFADLPVGVTRAVMERVPEAEREVDGIKQEMWGDHKIYVVSFKQDLRYPTLYIVADGTMLIPAR